MICIVKNANFHYFDLQVSVVLVVNFIILVSTFSVANVSTYGVSRIVLALVENEQVSYFLFSVFP